MHTQEFVDGAEIRHAGGNPVREVTRPGPVSLPFAAAMDVRAALLMCCAHVQLAAPSTVDAATQVLGIPD